MDPPLVLGFKRNERSSARIQRLLLMLFVEPVLQITALLMEPKSLNFVNRDLSGR